MPETKYVISLSAEEEQLLKNITHKGNVHTAPEALHAQVLLHSNKPDLNIETRQLAKQPDILPATLSQIKIILSSRNVSCTVQENPDSPSHGRQDYRRFRSWSNCNGIRPCSGRVCRMDTEAPGGILYGKTIYCFHFTYKDWWTANSNELRPCLSKYRCIPKQNNASFMCNMEDVLIICQRLHNPGIPLICMDEKLLRMLDKARERTVARPMTLNPYSELFEHFYCEKIDSGYVRCGTAGIFMFTEAPGGWCHAFALSTHTKGNYAKWMCQAAEEYYSDCEKIIIVSDNLSTQQVRFLWSVQTFCCAAAFTKVWDALYSKTW